MILRSAVQIRQGSTTFLSVFLEVFLGGGGFKISIPVAVRFLILSVLVIADNESNPSASCMTAVDHHDGRQGPADQTKKARLNDQ